MSHVKKAQAYTHWPTRCPKRARMKDPSLHAQDHQRKSYKFRLGPKTGESLGEMGKAYPSHGVKNDKVSPRHAWYWRHPTQVTRRPFWPMYTVQSLPNLFPYAHVNSLSQPSYPTSQVPFQPNSRFQTPAPQSPHGSWSQSERTPGQAIKKEKRAYSNVIDWVIT